MSKQLTDKQMKFVEVFRGNATEAARLAGYEGNDKTLAQVGYENLRKPEILKAIRERGDEEHAARVATRIKRQAFWTEIMAAETVEMKDRLKASELLARSEADFIDRHELSGPDGKPIETVSSLPDDRLEARLSELLAKVKLPDEPRRED